MDILKIDDKGMKAWDGRDPEGFASLLADNFTWMDSTMPKPMKKKEEAKQYMNAWFEAFPDMRSKQVRRVVGENNWLAAEVEFTGTNSGPLSMGGKQMPATGKSVKGRGVYFAHVENGKIVEFRSYPDSMGMMAQLGMMG